MEPAAEAEAEQIRRRARGEADAIFAKMEAQARGVQEVLSKQAEGFANLVKAPAAARFGCTAMLVDKIEELVKIQVEAVKNLNIDKITVWDSAGGKDGNSSTANFLSGIMKAIPPLSDTFKMAGLRFPLFSERKSRVLPLSLRNLLKHPRPACRNVRRNAFGIISGTVKNHLLRNGLKPVSER